MEASLARIRPNSCANSIANSPPGQKSCETQFNDPCVTHEKSAVKRELLEKSCAGLLDAYSRHMARPGTQIPEKMRRTQVFSVRVPPHVRVALDATAQLWGMNRSQAMTHIVMRVLPTLHQSHNPQNLKP